MLVWFAGLSSGLLASVAFIPYARQTLYGDVRPNPVSWWIWTWLGLVSSVAYFVAGGSAATAAICVACVVGPFVLGILATRKRVKEKLGLTWSEGFCITGGLSGIAAWIWTSDARIGLAICLATEAFAAFPTTVQAWVLPRSECRVGWGLMFLAGIVNLGAVEKWDHVTVLQPLLLVLDSGVIFAIVVLRR